MGRKVVGWRSVVPVARDLKKEVDVLMWEGKGRQLHP